MLWLSYLRRMDTIKQRTTFLLTAEVRRLLKTLAGKYGLTMTGMIETLVREKAKTEGLWQ